MELGWLLRKKKVHHNKMRGTKEDGISSGFLLGKPFMSLVNLAQNFLCPALPLLDIKRLKREQNEFSLNLLCNKGLRENIGSTKSRPWTKSESFFQLRRMRSLMRFYVPYASFHTAPIQTGPCAFIAIAPCVCYAS